MKNFLKSCFVKEKGILWEKGEPMKFFNVILFLAALVLIACDSESSSASSSPYGDQRYERHAPGSDAWADCYVYAKGNLFSLVFEQHFGAMGDVTMVSQVEVESPIVMHEEVTMMGLAASEVSLDYCNGEKAVYEQALGGTVTCSKSKVVADAVISDPDVDASDLESARSSAVFKLSLTCDSYIEDFMSEE
jgi:hypothetical protein